MTRTRFKPCGAPQGIEPRTAWFGLLAMVVTLAIQPGMSAQAGPAERLLYETRFEPAEGFDPEFSLIGQGGWVGDGAGGNGLVTNFFAGEGQHAFIGFVTATNGGNFLNVWRPVNYQPGPTNPPLVAFSLLMSIEDSVSATNRDDFRWSVFNFEGDRLFTLDFDNNSLEISYLLDDNAFMPTGRTFTNSVTYLLEVSMDFERNLWTAQLDGSVLVSGLRITTRNSPLNFGDVDAVWAIRTPGHAGDNYMVFDRLRIVAREAPPPSPPRLQAFRQHTPGSLLVRYFGTAGVTYVVEVTSNLRTWQPLITNTVPSNGHFDYLDEGGGPVRFYRMVEP